MRGWDPHPLIGNPDGWEAWKPEPAKEKKSGPNANPSYNWPNPFLVTVDIDVTKES